jgi:hypothetical protein
MNTRPPYRHAPTKRPPPPPDTRPRLPGAPGPKPAIISRQDTIIELRTIYRLLDTEQIHAAKARLITLGRNLQA